MDFAVNLTGCILAAILNLLFSPMMTVWHPLGCLINKIQQRKILYSLIQVSHIFGAFSAIFCQTNLENSQRSFSAF